MVDFGKRTPRYRLFGRPAESAASLRSRIVDQLSELGRKEIRAYDAQRRPTIFINDAPPAIDFSIPL